MKAVCFYHEADSDGHCSGAIVRHFIKTEGFLKEQGIEDVQCIGINYGYDPAVVFESTDKDTYVFLVDFTLDSACMCKLETHVHKVIWIDHHISRINANENLKHLAGSRSTEHSAALLAWLWFCKEVKKAKDKEAFDEEAYDYVIPPAIRMISEYDTWNHDTAGQVVTFEKGLSILDTNPSDDASFDFWEHMFKVGEVADMNDPEQIKARFHWDAIMQIMNLGGVCMTYKLNQDDRWMKKSFVSTIHSPIGDFECVAFNGHLEDSYSFDYSKFKDIDIKCWYYFNGKGYKYSFRSKEADVSKIAESFGSGGGGHRDSAGVFLTYDLFDPRKTEETKNETKESGE